MKNFIKKTSVNVLVAVLILNFFGFAALAADEITIELSADSGYVGSSVTVYGTASAGQWVSIKVIDAGGAVLHFSAVSSNSDGIYTDTLAIPKTDPRYLTIIVGAGGDVATAEFTVNEPLTYTASIDPTDHTFTSVTVGYSEQDAQKFTITNNGSGTINCLSAQLTTGTNFEISTALFSNTISSGFTTSLSVRPVAGLSAGTYTDTLSITGENGVSLSTAIEFTVNEDSSGGSSGGNDEYDEDEENDKEITVGDGEGNTIEGSIEETEDGFDITIRGDDFSGVTGGPVSVVTQYVEITFDQTAAEYIADAAGSGSIVISVVNADVSELSDEAQELIGDRPAYEFFLTAGDSDLSTFGGGLAYVTIPYEPEDGEDVNRIVIYYITDDGELIVMTDSNYDGTSINAKFSTGHFSMYAVGYNDVSFDDVSEDSWYYNAVTFCAAREITTGTGDGTTFSPEASLTRGQFIVMLMRAYNIEVDETLTDNFDDAGDTYYTAYLATAKSLGITSGVGENMFAPEDEITRQDMFTLLYRSLDILGELPETDGTSSLSDYSDADKISDYAEEAMETLVAAGIISGSDGNLDPLGSSTRAQLAQVLYNLLSM